MNNSTWEGPRKIVSYTERLMSENGGVPEADTMRISVAAVVRNPWIGTGPRTELFGEARAIAPQLARLLTDEIVRAVGGVRQIEAFGKGSIVGCGGEIEHGAALMHTPYFGNLVREYLDGTSIISFNESRGDAGDVLVVPVWHKTAAATRSHYQSVSVRVPDAPRDDEIVIALAAATGPRPHSRIGDRTTDSHVDSDNIDIAQQF